MESTILILLLPFFSFLLLGVFGKWFSHKAAGLVGTAVLDRLEIAVPVPAVLSGLMSY